MRKNVHSRFRALRSALAAIAAVVLCLAMTAPAGAQNAFNWEAGVYDENGAFDPTAGGRPHHAITEMWFKRATRFLPVANLRDLIVEVPDGLVVNPRAAGRCTRSQLASLSCPQTAHVGNVRLEGLLNPNAKLYNMVPRRGTPAELAFSPANSPGFIFMQGAVTADGSVQVRIDDANAGAPVFMTRVTMFGIPQDPAHGTGSTLPRRPLVTNPTSCVGPVDTIAHVNWWEDLAFERHVSRTPVGGEGCEVLDFKPRATIATTTSVAGAPTGLEFEITQRQPQNPDGLAPAHIKDVEVALPEGMTVNPSAADGIAGCSPAQIALDSTDPVTCPRGAKIGDVEIVTPLLEEAIGGAVYLAQPYDNPFGGLLGLYLVAESEERGIRIKLAGAVQADEETGRLTTRFESNPQLPFSRLSVSIGGGPRSPLTNPRDCGTAEATTRLSPWSAADPDNPTAAETVTQASTIEVVGCSTGFAPWLVAGSESPLARGSSPFLLSVARGDGDEEIVSIEDIKLPPGLLGDISSVAVCPDAQADAGTCGDDSRIGRVETAVGVGSHPAWLPQAGKLPTSVSLAGPYRGAPYSLSVVVPAQAGPFDLGRIVARAPLHVDTRTARLSSEVAQSRFYDRTGSLAQVLEGGLPTILEGIPLRVREIRVIADRPGFMVNPSSCRPKQVRATVVSVAATHTAVANRFQAAACDALPFRPKIAMRLLGRRQARTGGHPALRTVVRQRGVREAGIRRAVAKLPRSLALDPANAQALCEFEDGTRPDLEDHCPKASIVGRAKAVSPLLKRPLVGDVYFVKNVRIDPETGNSIRTLPMLVAALRGEIAINLRGKSSVDRRNRLVTTFARVPDAPIARFHLNVRGGRNGIIAVTRTRRAEIDLCARPRGQVVEMRMQGHNGGVRIRDIRLRTPCPGWRDAVARVCRKRADGRRALRRCVRRVAKARAERRTARRGDRN